MFYAEKYFLRQPKRIYLYYRCEHINRISTYLQAILSLHYVNQNKFSICFDLNSQVLLKMGPVWFHLKYLKLRFWPTEGEAFVQNWVESAPFSFSKLLSAMPFFLICLSLTFKAPEIMRRQTAYTPQVYCRFAAHLHCL